MPRFAWAARGRMLVLLGLANAVLIFFFGRFGERIYGSSPYDVADLELAFSASRFGQILSSWNGPGGVAAFRQSVLLLDFAFPLAYGLFLHGLYAWTCARVRAPQRRLFAAAPLLAAALDWAENVLLLWLTARAVPSGSLVWLMSSCAAVKFSLLALNLAGLLLTFLESPYGWVLIVARFSLLSVALGSLPFLVVPQGQDVLRSLVDPLTPVSVRACALGALVLWAASVWYWSRVLLMLRRDQVLRRAEQLEPAEGFVLWVPRVLGSATLFLAALAFLRAAALPGGRRGLLLLFAGICLVLGLLFLAFVWKRRALLRVLRPGAPVPQATEVFDWRSLPAGARRAVLAAVALSLLLLVLFTLRPVAAGQALGTLSVLALFAANAVFIGSWTAFLSRLWRVPFVSLALLLAAVFSFWNDNHAVRLARDGRGRPLPLQPRPELRKAFARFLAERRAAWPGPGPMPVFLVAAEGGGIRAAYWSAVVLARLQDLTEGRFGPQVFGLSGVSGGSLGVGTFAALLADERTAPCPDRPAGGPSRGRLQRCAEQALAPDFLSPVLAKMLSPDFLQWFVPAPLPWFDRAWALEDAWAAGYRRANPKSERFGAPFLGLWREDPLLPNLFLNGTHVRTGRRALLSSVSWQDADVPDTYDLHELLQADLPLVTAMHNSARFAYVSPAGRLTAVDGSDHGHVVDGGYFENSGAATLYDVWRSLADAGAAGDARFVVLYLCNNPARCYLQDHALPPGTTTTHPEDLADLASPLRALLGARDARGALALAELRREERDGRLQFVELGVCSGLIQHEKQAPLPLGWTLSEGVRAEMTRQAAGEGCVANGESLCTVERLLGQPCP